MRGAHAYTTARKSQIEPDQALSHPERSERFVLVALGNKCARVGQVSLACPWRGGTFIRSGNRYWLLPHGGDHLGSIDAPVIGRQHLRELDHHHLSCFVRRDPASVNLAGNAKWLPEDDAYSAVTRVRHAALRLQSAFRTVEWQPLCPSDGDWHDWHIVPER